MRSRVLVLALLVLSAPQVSWGQTATPTPAPPPANLDPTGLSGTTNVTGAGRGTAPDHRGRWGTPPAWEESPGVTLWDAERLKHVGINAGPFVTGRAVIARGSLGEAAIEAGRMFTRGHVGVGTSGSNLAGRAHFDFNVTAIGAAANSRVFSAGDPRTMTWATANGFATAFVGAEANGDAYLRVGTRGVGAKGRVGGLLGAKAVAMGMTGTTLCGVRVNGRGAGSVQAGLGGDLSGTFRIDWATFTVAVGAEASATVGVGAGLGGDIEVSLEPLLRDPKAAARCARDLAEAGKRQVQALFPWDRGSLAGSNAARQDDTRAAQPDARGAASTSAASGAGMARD